MNPRLPWHEDLFSQIISLHVAERLPNALALIGPSGWGEGHLLAAVTAALLSLESSDPREVAHPDLRWVVPDGGVIKVDQIRLINEFAVRTGTQGGPKIIAISDAHLLNENAANALLKTLEEPPLGTHILLATCHWGRLLPTVRSRTTRFSIRADTSAALKWLREQGIELDAAMFAEYGSAPISAQRALQQQDLSIWLGVLHDNPVLALEQIQAEDDLGAFLERWYRRLNQHLQGHKIPGLKATARDCFAFADELLDIKRQLDVSNATNARLAMDRLAYSWRRMLSNSLN